MKAAIFFTILFLIFLYLSVIVVQKYRIQKIVTVETGYLEIEREITTLHPLLVKGLSSSKPLVECEENYTSEHKTKPNEWGVDYWGNISNYVWTVELDRRYIAGPRSHLRLLLMATGISEIFCHIWIKPLPGTVVVEGVIDEINSVVHKDGYIYNLYSVTCKFSHLVPLPTSVSVNFHLPCRQIYNQIEVHPLEGEMISMGVCALLEDVTSLQFVEWIEYHSAIGVKHFTLYDIHDDAAYEFEDYLKMYNSSKNILKTVRMRPPFKVENEDEKLMQITMKTAALNACILRNKDFYNFTLVIEMRHFIALKPPYNTLDKLRDLLTGFSYRNSRPGSYTLQTLVFPIPINSTKLSISYNKWDPIESHRETSVLVSSQDCHHIHTTKCLLSSEIEDINFQIPTSYAASHFYKPSMNSTCNNCILDTVLIFEVDKIKARVEMIVSKTKDELKK